MNQTWDFHNNKLTHHMPRSPTLVIVDIRLFILEYINFRPLMGLYNLISFNKLIELALLNPVYSLASFETTVFEYMDNCMTYDKHSDSNQCDIWLSSVDVDALSIALEAFVIDLDKTISYSVRDYTAAGYVFECWLDPYSLVIKKDSI